MKTKIANRRLSALLALTPAIAALFTVNVVLGQNENSAIKKTDKPDYAALAKVPEKARARRNPLEGQADAVAAGGKLFAEHCAECHGSDAQGGKKAPSLHNEEVQQASSGALFWILTNGMVRRGMPVWSKLPEPQRWQIVSFLKAARD